MNIDFDKARQLGGQRLVNILSYWEEYKMPAFPISVALARKYRNVGSVTVGHMRAMGLIVDSPDEVELTVRCLVVLSWMKLSTKEEVKAAIEKRLISPNITGRGSCGKGAYKRLCAWCGATPEVTIEGNAMHHRRSKAWSRWLARNPNGSVEKAFTDGWGLGRKDVYRHWRS